MFLYAQLMLRICSVEILDMNYFVVLLDDLGICFASASKLFQLDVKSWMCEAYAIFKVQPDAKNLFQPRLNPLSAAPRPSFDDRGNLLHVYRLRVQVGPGPFIGRLSRVLRE